MSDFRASLSSVLTALRGNPRPTRYLRRRVPSRWGTWLLLAIAACWFSLALPPFSRAIAQAPPPSGAVLLQRARTHRDNGQLAEAAQQLERAIATFSDPAQRLQRAVAFSNLSLVRQQQQRWQAAQQASDRSLALLNANAHLDSDDLNAVRAGAFAVRGRLQAARGRFQAAARSWRSASDLYADSDREASLNAQIERVRAMQQAGRTAQACQTLLTALSVRRDDRPLSPPETLPEGFALANTWDCALYPGELQRLRETVLASGSNTARGARLLADVLRTVGVLERERRGEVSVDGARELLVLLAENAEGIPAAERAAIALSRAETERALARRSQVRTPLEPDGTAKPNPETQQHWRQARQAYATAAAIAPDLGALAARARLYDLTLAVEFADVTPELAAQLWQNVKPDLARLPGTRTGIYTQLYLVERYFQSRAQTFNPTANPATPDANPYRFLSPDDLTTLVDRAEAQAATLGSDRLNARILGDRGQLAVLAGRWERAEALTQQAIALATRLSPNDSSPELRYRLHWQLARIQRRQGQRFEAIAAYQQAVQDLAQLRRNLNAVATEQQFDFRDRVAPLYRQYVDVLLDPAEEPSEPQLREARAAIEALQLAEIDDYFRDACSTVKTTNLDRLVDRTSTAEDANTAVFYGIWLGDRLEIVLKLPGLPLEHARSPLDDPEQALEDVRQLRSLLLQAGNRSRIFPVAGNIYQWTIAPVAERLRDRNIDTLVFVLDGDLRNIPMSVLFDGDRYLIEDYAIAVTPGLQLLPPQPLTSGETRAIAAGLANPPERIGGRTFPPLPSVARELPRLLDTLPVVESLVDEAFVTDNLRRSLSIHDVSILHLGTHGQFSSNPEDTFLAFYDRLLAPDALGSLLQQRSRPLDLLVLSACQTAEGDDRALLGLSGLAVRSGARSTLATLWPADDFFAADLVLAFYEQLQIPGTTKARALQQAQLAQIAREDEPLLWASFILVGNWR